MIKLSVQHIGVSQHVKQYKHEEDQTETKFGVVPIHVQENG